MHWRWTPYGKALHAREALRAYLRGVIRERRDQPGTDALGLLMAGVLRAEATLAALVARDKALRRMR